MSSCESLFELQFYSPVNILEVMSSRSINLLFSWAGLLMVNQYFVHILSPIIDNWLASVEGGEWL